MIIWIWLSISAAWFAVNWALIERHDGNFWFVACLPFFIGLLFLVGVGATLGGWRKPPDDADY
ncbi:MAG: hypothetical protein HYU37_03275 [Acidobacteria bacterium]|nr:hypothetical protein [Acidobacteriota bacterium]